MIEASPELQEELALCNRWGIPHGFFLGGPFRWDELSQGKALAFDRYDRSKCAACRTRRVEWDEDRDAYVAVSDTCPGCLVTHQAQQEMSEGGKKEIKPYIKLGLSPRHIAEAEAEAQEEAEAEQRARQREQQAAGR